MKNGNARFEFYLEQIEKLMLTAATQPDPGLWLYQNNARTPAFMVEGLAKLYSGLHDRKAFEKIGEDFKLIEDAIGAIDYYDSFAKDFAIDKKVPAAVTKYVLAKASEKVCRFNEVLKEKGWLGAKADRLAKIRKKLRSVDWMKPKAEVAAIEKFYKLNIIKIDAFWTANKGGFTDVEAQVHELRRKLRWLSIYPQALRGCIQLKASPTTDPKLKKYLTPEIVNSPYNKLPEPEANKHQLLLSQDYFLALSWLIAELGKLKDEGLCASLIAEAIEQTKPPAKKGVTKASENLLDMGAILVMASDACRTYFNEKNLEKLLIGTTKTSNKDS